MTGSHSGRTLATHCSISSVRLDRLYELFWEFRRNRLAQQSVFVMFKRLDSHRLSEAGLAAEAFHGSRHK